MVKSFYHDLGLWAQGHALLHERAVLASQEEAITRVAKLPGERNMPVPQCIGHRIVHGGAQLTEHCRIDDSVLNKLKAAAVFAPLHRTDATVLRRVQSVLAHSEKSQKMLRDVKNMCGFAIEATDGALGHIDDFYFDDEAWVLRYLVVETGKWLSNRKVLALPYLMDEPNWSLERLPVRLTREQVRTSPSIDTDKPVFRQYEMSLGGHYDYPNYWGGPGLWGAGYYPWTMYTGLGNRRAVSNQGAVQDGPRLAANPGAERSHDDPHLRSCNAVIEYHIHATDGDVGHVQGMLVDEKSWAIRYLVINTSNWWLGHQVLVAPKWITQVSWVDRQVVIDLTRQAIKDSPHWDPASLPDRVQEALVHQHYGRKGYWEDETLPRPVPPDDADRAKTHR